MTRFALLVLLAPACDPAKTSPLEPRHAQALRGVGITEGRGTGPAFFGCSDSDSLIASVGFVGKNAQGEHVEGSICCGLILKGCTVRF